MDRKTAADISYGIGLMVQEIQQRFQIELNLPRQSELTTVGKIQGLYEEVSRHAERTRNIILAHIED